MASEFANLARDLELLSSLVGSFFTGQLAPTTSDQSISCSQRLCLRFIWLNQPVAIGEVAHGLGCSHPAATKAVGRLANRHLVKRIPDPHDRRNVLVRVTPAGREAMEGVDQEHQHYLAQILAHMDQHEQASLREAAQGFLRAAAQAFPQQARQVCLHCGERHQADCSLGRFLPGHQPQLTTRHTPPLPDES